MEAYQEALVYRTPQSAPLDYAVTQNNLGAAYRDLAALEDQEGNLQRAVDAYQEALKYWTPQTPRSLTLRPSGISASLTSTSAICQPQSPAGAKRRSIIG